MEHIGKFFLGFTALGCFQPVLSTVAEGSDDPESSIHRTRIVMRPTPLPEENDPSRSARLSAELQSITAGILNIEDNVSGWWDGKPASSILGMIHSESR